MSGPLDQIGECAESKLLRALFASLKADPVLKVFRPWYLVDTPQIDKFIAYGAYSACVQPLGLTWDDSHTVSMQDVKISAGISIFLPYEDQRNNSDSQLLSLRLGRYLATKIYATESYQDPDVDPQIWTPLNVSVTSMRPLQPIPGDKTNVRILTWAVDLLQTVDPRTGRVE